MSVDSRALLAVRLDLESDEDEEKEEKEDNLRRYSINESGGAYYLQDDSIDDCYLPAYDSFLEEDALCPTSSHDGERYENAAKDKPDADQPQIGNADQSLFGGEGESEGDDCGGGGGGEGGDEEGDGRAEVSEDGTQGSSDDDTSLKPLLSPQPQPQLLLSFSSRGEDGGGGEAESDSRTPQATQVHIPTRIEGRRHGSQRQVQDGSQQRHAAIGNKWKKLCYCGMCLFAVLVVILVAVLSMILVLRFTVGRFYSTSEHYKPAETHLVPFSRFLCQSLTFRSTYKDLEKQRMSFYILQSQPGLFDNSTFPIAQKLSDDEKEHLLYLHSGSEINVSACFVNSAEIVPLTGFYIVKGIDGYNGTYLRRSDVKSVVFEFVIYRTCSDSGDPFTYTVVESDYYYLIFQTSTPGNPALHLSVNMSFFSTSYSLYNMTILRNCSLSTNEPECSLSVPLHTTSYALLTFHTLSPDVEWLDEIPLEIICEPHLWVYLIPPLLLLCLISCAIFCCCGVRKSLKIRRCFSCYWPRKKTKGKKFVVLIICCLLALSLCGAFFSLWLFMGRSYSDIQQSYGPTDTRLLPVSSPLCQDLSIQTSYNGSNEYDVALYMFSSKPELSKSEQFQISENISREVVQHYLFYLNSGSKVTGSACFINSSVISPFTKLYIVKGAKGYNGGYLKSDIKSVVAEFPISYHCANNATPFSYFIEDSDFYYLVFHSGLLGSIPVLHLSINMTFRSTKYSLDTPANSQSCSLSSSDDDAECSLSVPMFNSHALLVIDSLYSDVDRFDKIPLVTNCKPRLWVYIVPPLLVLVCMTLFCGFIFKCAGCRNWLGTRLKKLRLSKKCVFAYYSPYLLLVLLIGGLLGLHFTIGTSYTNEGENYGPTDSRLVPFSSVLCQRLTLMTNYEGSEIYRLNFQALPSYPVLDSYKISSFSETVLAAVEHHYVFYMHSGSTLTVKACFTDVAAFVPLTVLYIVKGVDGYHNFLKNELQSVRQKYHITSHKCTNQTYSVFDDDFYYIVFSTTTPGVPVLSLSVEMSLNLTQYSLKNHPTRSSCALSTSDYGSKCSLDIPLLATSYALLTIHPVSSDLNVLDQIPVVTHCEPRLWVYATPPALLLLILLCASGCCVGSRMSPTFKAFVTCSAKCRSLVWYCIPYSLLVILVGGLLAVRFTVGNFYSGTEVYMPNAARLLPFSRILCQNLKLKTMYREDSSAYNISVSMLSSHPGLFEHDTFSILKQVLNANEQRYLFYLNSGSQVRVSACFDKSSVIIPMSGLYIIKGIHGYNKTHITKSDVKSVVASFPIISKCMSNHDLFTYSITEGDYYYLIFQTITPGNPILHLNLNMSFFSTSYSLYNTTTLSNCTLSTDGYESECSLSVPLLTTSYALLAVHPLSSDVERLDEIPVETFCEPRLWIYLVPPFLLALVLACASGCCLGLKFKTFKKIVSFDWLRKTQVGKVLILYFSLAMLLVGAILTLYFTLGASYSNDGQGYTANDTRLIPFSNVLCESLQLQSEQGADGFEMSLYMLPSRPELSRHDSISISDRITGAELEHHYEFFMHAGSEIAVNACFIKNTPLTSLYVVKGAQGYDGRSLNTNSSSVVADFVISSECSNSVSPFLYFVRSDDIYFLVFHSSELGIVPELNLNVNMTINRTHYALPYPAMDQCTLTFWSESECSLSVPLFSTSHALLTISSDVNTFHKIPLKTNCRPRIWVYVTPPLLLTSIFIIAGCCYWCSRKFGMCGTVHAGCALRWNSFKRLFSKKCVFCYSIPYILVILSVGGTLALKFTLGTSYSNHGLSYGPTNSRLVPFSNVFCGGLRLTTHYRGSQEYQLSLHMLLSEPGFSPTESDTFSERIEGIEKHYSLYLLPGSEVAVSACFIDAAAFVPSTYVRLVRGIYGGKQVDLVAESDILHSCGESDVSSLSYEVDDTDEAGFSYYLIFQTSTDGFPVLSLNANFSFTQTHYDISNDSISDSCRVSTSDIQSTCSVSVPLFTTSYALLTITPVSSNVKWFGEIPLETHCEPRLWVYVMPPTFVLLILACLSCCCFATKSSSAFRKIVLCKCLGKQGIVRVLFVNAILAVILAGFVLGVRFTLGTSYSNDGHGYSPRDTRLIPFSNIFCQSLSLESDNSSDVSNISLHVLPFEPHLYTHDNFSISRKVKAQVEWEYSIYMHFGSKVVVSACFDDEAEIVPFTKLYITRKNSGGYFRSESKSIVAESGISSYCKTGNQPLSYIVDGEGFYNVELNTSMLDMKPAVSLEVNVAFYRTHYIVPHDLFTSSCTLTSSDIESACSVGVPLFNYSYALLDIQPLLQDVNRTGIIPVKTHCQPRLWLYIASPIALAIMLVCVTCCCCCFMRSRNFRRFSCYFFPYLLVVALASALVGLYFTLGASFSNDGQIYSPVVSRLIPFSNVLCKSLSVQSSGLSNYNLHFYMLASSPQLDDSFNEDYKLDIEGEAEHHLLLFLHAESEVTVSACFVNASVITSYTKLSIVKGIHGYDGGQLKVAAEETFDIFYACNANSTPFQPFSVEEEDFYHLVFHTESTGVVPELYLHTEMSFDVADYSIDNGTIIDSCTLSAHDQSPKCSLSVPLFSHAYAILKFDQVFPDTNKLAQIPIQTHCFPRLWIYIVPPSLLLVISVLLQCLCYRRTLRHLFHRKEADINSASQQEFADVANKFQLDWAKGTPPAVKAVFVINNKKARMRRWQAYRLSLGRHTDIETYYHGTKLCCNIRHTKHFCRSADCGACRIPDTGFSRSKIRSHIPFQRFGPGFYLAPNSSKSDDYARASNGCKAIIICDVCPGKKYRLKYTTPLNGPPNGYNSIYGDKGGVLNYEEIVLQNPDAILPRYIVIY